VLAGVLPVLVPSIRTVGLLFQGGGALVWDLVELVWDWGFVSYSPRLGDCTNVKTWTLRIYGLPAFKKYTFR